MADEYTSKHSGATIDEGIDLALTADQIQKGYYSNNAFYSDSSHTTLIPAKSTNLYIDLTSNINKPYAYNGTNYIPLAGGSSGGNVDDVQVNGASIVANAIANIIVDTALSGSSNNPVKNSVIYAALNERVLILQGVANAGKQLVVDANGNISLDPIKRIRTFESLTIEGVSDTFYVETITDGTNVMKIATSMANPSIVYRSSDGGSSYHMPYAIWHS